MGYIKLANIILIELELKKINSKKKDHRTLSPDHLSFGVE
jgi:hypothetical protein